jgi:hypothetical protein
MKEPLLVESAKWLYENRTKADWWTPIVLTSDNPDRTTVGLNIDEAYKVFVELRKRRLIKHVLTVVAGAKISAFEMVIGKEEDWLELINKKNAWELYIWPGAKWLFSQTWLLILFIGGILLTNFLDRYCANLLDNPEEIPRYNVQIEEGQFEKLLKQQRTEGLSFPPILKVQLMDGSGTEIGQKTNQTKE